MLPHKPNPNEGRLSKKFHRLEHGTSSGLRLSVAPEGSFVNDNIVPIKAPLSSTKLPSTSSTHSLKRRPAPAADTATCGMAHFLSMQYRTNASSSFAQRPALPASAANEQALRQFRTALGHANHGGGASDFSTWKNQQLAWEQAGRGYCLTAPTTQGKGVPLRSEC